MAASPGFVIGFKCHLISLHFEICFMLVFFITSHLCEASCLLLIGKARTPKGGVTHMSTTVS